ncbi:AAA-type ATPase domain containing protein [Klebsormidium nitens]|uniref:AAA-type ATPase domain containing protein n=1 Tax=Klebsormidium nitens TaxID=105231 RepID=A0A1Y1HVU9_KLENI|nr:AAA-type ATPase domain containing protein [Klebsormidium nitens]|eukprot:GAQ81111.1 AAA-type ATPase domain containing protein [Klebsormidium nitens]
MERKRNSCTSSLIQQALRAIDNYTAAMKHVQFALSMGSCQNSVREDGVKEILQENFIVPLRFPNLFKGKTLIGSSSSSSLRTLKGIFELARQLSPAIIFFDEIDSLLLNQVPLPDAKTRQSIVQHYLKEIDTELTDAELSYLSEETEGFSGSDLRTICRAAAMRPVREAVAKVGQHNSDEKLTSLRSTSITDFQEVLFTFKPASAATKVSEEATMATRCP